MATGQFPKRRETDEQAAKRAARIKERNEQQGVEENRRLIPYVKKADRKTDVFIGETSG